MFNAIENLGVYYSYNKSFKSKEKLINIVLKIEKLLRLWRIQNLSNADKVTIIKTLAISKMVHHALVKIIPNSIIVDPDKIKKHFIWKMAILNLNRTWCDMKMMF